MAKPVAAGEALIAPELSALEVLAPEAVTSETAAAGISEPTALAPEELIVDGVNVVAVITVDVSIVEATLLKAPLSLDDLSLLKALLPSADPDPVLVGVPWLVIGTVDPRAFTEVVGESALPEVVENPASPPSDKLALSDRADKETSEAEEATCVVLVNPGQYSVVSVTTPLIVTVWVEAIAPPVGISTEYTVETTVWPSASVVVKTLVPYVDVTDPP